MLLVWSPYGTWGARGKAPSQVRGRDLGGVSRTGGARARGLCLQVPSHLLSATVGKVPRVIRGDPFRVLAPLPIDPDSPAEGETKRA